MRFMQMKAATFLVREKGFYPKSLCVQATRLLGCVHIRDQIQGRFTSLCPTTDEHNGTIRFARKPHLRSRDEGAWLATRPQGVETKGLAVPPRRPVATRPAHIRPAFALYRVLQAGPIKCALAEEEHLRTFRYWPPDQLDQGGIEGCGKRPPPGFEHPPSQPEGDGLFKHAGA